MISAEMEKLMMVAKNGGILADHVHDAFLFSQGGRLYLADYAEHERAELHLRVWVFDLVRGHWVSLGRQAYTHGHRFTAVAELTRRLYLDGKPLPSAPNGNPDSPRRSIRGGMERVTVNGEVYLSVTKSVRHDMQDDDGRDATTFFAMHHGAREAYVYVYDQDTVKIG
jgi:hypothetical protein